MLEHSETKYNISAVFSYLLKYRRNNNKLVDPKTLIAKSLITTIEDVRDYLNISTETFFEYATHWTKREENLFHATDQGGHLFYNSWKGRDAQYNICANALNQHLDQINFKAIYNFFAHNESQKTIIDWGCGTASLSISFVKEGLIAGSVFLLDVNNDIKDFVEFRLKKHKLQQSVAWLEVTSFSRKGSCDGLYCIDVLEHLEKAGQIFINNIHPLIKIGGLLYLKAPWRGQITHLDSAADDFYLNGARRFLSSHYRLLNRFLPMDIACVYQKIKE